MEDIEKNHVGDFVDHLLLIVLHHLHGDQAHHYQLSHESKHKVWTSAAAQIEKRVVTYELGTGVIWAMLENKFILFYPDNSSNSLHKLLVTKCHILTFCFSRAFSWNSSNDEFLLKIVFVGKGLWAERPNCGTVANKHWNKYLNWNDLHDCRTDKRMYFLGVSEKGAAYMCMKLDAAMHNPWNWSGGTNVLPISLWRSTVLLQENLQNANEQCAGSFPLTLIILYSLRAYF